MSNISNTEFPGWKALSNNMHQVMKKVRRRQRIKKFFMWFWLLAFLGGIVWLINH